MNRYGVIGLMTLACIFLFGSVKYAADQKPIPKGKRSPNWDELSDKLLKFWEPDIEAYRKYTKDPQSLRPQAEEFLRTVLLGNVFRKRGPGDEKTVAMGKKLLDQGCDDPLVKSYYASVAYKSMDYDSAIPFLQKAVVTLRESDYPPECKRVVVMADYSHCSVLQDVQNWKEFREEAINMAAARVGDSSIGSFQQQFIQKELEPFFRCDTFNWKDSEALYNACLKQPKADPWTMEMIAGCYYRTMAWHYRGGGYASTVTADGWEKFGENLKKAAEHFEKAYELHPEYPEAASRMVFVSLAGGSEVSPREWFDRAVAAQMDYTLAYDNYRWHLRPRWGGSHAAMYEFACECAATKRYDSNVPYLFVLTIDEIDDERGGSGESWKRPGVYTRANRILENMACEPSREDGKRLELAKSEVMSTHASLAAYVGKYDDARLLLDKLGDKLNFDAFSLRFAGPDLRLAEIYAMTGKGASHIVEAMNIYNSQESPRSDAVLEQGKILLNKAFEAEDNEYSKNYCKALINEFDDLSAFNTGKWVEKKFGQKMWGWKVAAGNWKVNNPSSAVGHSQKPYGKVIANSFLEMPVPLEVEFKIGASGGFLCDSRLGLYVPQKGDSSVVNHFLLDVKNGKVVAEIMGTTKEKKVDLYTNNSVRVQMADGRAVFYVNDELCIDHRDENFHPSGILNIGTSDHMWYLIAMNISDVRVRKWDPTKSSAKELARLKPNPKLPADPALLMTFDENTVRADSDLLTSARSLTGRSLKSFKARGASDGKVGSALICENGGELRILEHFVNRQPEYTITAWIKRKDDDHLWMYTETAAGIIFGVNAAKTGAISVSAWRRDKPGNWMGTSTTAGLVPADKWTFVTVRMSKGKKESSPLTIRVNDKSYQHELQRVHHDAMDYASIGAATGAGGDKKNGRGAGMIDELSIYRRALSDEEIETIYQMGLRGESLAAEPENLSLPNQSTNEDSDEEEQRRTPPSDGECKN